MAIITYEYEEGLFGITVDVHAPDGTEREADIAMSDSGHAGIYIGESSLVQVGDILRFFQDGIRLGGGTYNLLNDIKDTVDGLTPAQAVNLQITAEEVNQQSGSIEIAGMEINITDNSEISGDSDDAVHVPVHSIIVTDNPEVTGQ